jgi:hypothetical protein
MAWRPSEQLIEGELDNTTPGKVTGWMKFAGKRQQVTFDLDGNFHRDIRGAKIRFRGEGKVRAGYLHGFDTHQRGKVGDITAGRKPVDYVNYPYIEWYSNSNGRVVIELNPEQVEVIGRPIPAIESDPIDRAEQQKNMVDFLTEIANGLT